MIKISTSLLALTLSMNFAKGEALKNQYVGMWMTKDKYIRHELLPNGRYVEARGEKEKAYTGKYKISKDHIDYWDDTGFTADGDFKNGILYHAGMILYKEEIKDKKQDEE